jgi:hypothetical protein
VEDGVEGFSQYPNVGLLEYGVMSAGNVVNLKSIACDIPPSQGRVPVGGNTVRSVHSAHQCYSPGIEPDVVTRESSPVGFLGFKGPQIWWHTKIGELAESAFQKLCPAIETIPPVFNL